MADRPPGPDSFDDLRLIGGPHDGLTLGPGEDDEGGSWRAHALTLTSPTSSIALNGDGHVYVYQRVEDRTLLFKYRGKDPSIVQGQRGAPS